jgi:hypothetical protein
MRDGTDITIELRRGLSLSEDLKNKLADVIVQLILDEKVVDLSYCGTSGQGMIPRIVRASGEESSGAD